MVLVVPMYEEDAHGVGHLLQHRRRHRRRRHVPRQVPQDPHPARQGLLGEVLLPARATWATRSSRPPSARSASTSATTATSRRAPGPWASTAPRWCSSRRATSRGLSEYLWRIEQVSHAVANGYFVGTINRVGIETELGDDDFYGQSYFCDPRGQFIGGVGEPARRGAARPRHGPRPGHRGPPDLAVLPRPAPGRVRRPGPALAAPAQARRPPDGVRLHAQARPLDRADGRAHPAGRGGRLRLRLALRLATSCGATRTRS